MDGKYLLLLKDKLETFSGLFDLIKESAPYEIDVATTRELVSGKYKAALDRYKSGDIVIAIDDGFFADVERDIRNYLDTVEKKPFTNFLYLFDDGTTAVENLYTNSKNCYMLFHGKEDDDQVVHFHLFVLSVFDKAVFSLRLSDYIYNSFKEVVFGEILRKKTKELEMLKEELERRNRIDTLTGLYNRRALFEFLDTERSRTARYLMHISGVMDRPPEEKTGVEAASMTDEDMIEEIKPGNYGIFSVMMIDLDHFKTVNDTYGHLSGDKVLKALGQLFVREGILRKQDITGRFGGEEFIVILPNTSAKSALGPAKRLVRELDKIDFRGAENKVFKVTLSIGISEYHPSDRDIEMIIQRADKAMYYAKQHGRNQVVIFEKIDS